jgi:hypothetical protein
MPLPQMRPRLASPESMCSRGLPPCTHVLAWEKIPSYSIQQGRHAAARQAHARLLPMLCSTLLYFGWRMRSTPLMTWRTHGVVGRIVFSSGSVASALKFPRTWCSCQARCTGGGAPRPEALGATLAGRTHPLLRPPCKAAHRQSCSADRRMPRGSVGALRYLLGLVTRTLSHSHECDKEHATSTTLLQVVSFCGLSQ